MKSPFCLITVLRGLVFVSLICRIPASAEPVEIRGEVVDGRTGEPVAARIYLQDEKDKWHFVEAAAEDGKAVRYEKIAGVNPDSVEIHTTVTGGSFRATLEPGRYRLTVERGKECFPESREVIVGKEAQTVRVSLRRWINMAGHGWYSGDTHIHRELTDLPTVMLAEDLNVTFPLTYWVTKAGAPPGNSDKNIRGEIPVDLVVLDKTHVYWPRNTEYEISNVNGARHMLGGVFVLGHRSVLAEGVPPLSAMAARARAEGALFDLDKHAWPWAMALPPVMGVELYELANNHVWRTEFGFTNWTTPSAPHHLPPFSRPSGGERDWILYTLGNYYTLLNAGYPMQPTAGTANGVHPVPAGFGRVYVQLPEGFGYEGWKAGLEAGRSFVTTGPMLMATVNGRGPGEVFSSNGSPVSCALSGTVVSETPMTFLELIQNGKPVQLIRPQNRPTAAGAFESDLKAEVVFDESGWLAVRGWEDRPGGRIRYAHTAPWRVEIEGKPLLAPKEDRDYLVERMRVELERGRGVLPEAAIAEYEAALAAYEKIPVREESEAIARTARPAGNDDDLRFWLENMVWHHRYREDEVRRATGLSAAEVSAALDRFQVSDATRPAKGGETLKVLPYPGGRHPRTGFLDGAVDPERETKVSVFTPWDEASYVVVDVPEAIWSKPGLLYLAHTHVPTRWSKAGVTLPKLEWKRLPGGVLESERELPNGVEFGAKVTPGKDAVQFDLWLRNGSDEMLTDLRVQNCVMLQAAAGFNAQTSQNKRLELPFAAVQSEDGKRWIITAWTECLRPWANPPVPCLHSDPKFPDCPPGETRRLLGWLWFYEGDAIDEELARLKAFMAANAVEASRPK